MLTQMSSHELTEWMAYYKLEPFGDELIDLHFAKLDAIMTSNKDKQTEPKTFRIWQLEEPTEFDPQAFFDGLKEVALKAAKD